MIAVRVSDWLEASKELRWLIIWFECRGIAARIRHSRGKFAVYREMDLEMAERLGWVGDISYQASQAHKTARRNQVASGSWQNREMGRRRDECRKRKQGRVM